jgi:predicted lipoprotein with Yx(FWY)xxD motif
MNLHQTKWRAGLALATVGATAGLLMAPASASTTAGGKTAKVVTPVDRKPIGDMLATSGSKLSLYIHPSGPCTGGCLSVWPPLLMPTGKTVPEGEKCLKTVKTATKGQRQVTYDGQALYTFVEDSGHSVKGNGVGGFEAAAVVSDCS